MCIKKNINDCCNPEYTYTSIIFIPTLTKLAKEN